MYKTILVTGGLGYIGSHIVLELINTDSNVIIIDNLINSEIKTLEKIKKLVGESKYSKISFYKLDLVTDLNELDILFKNNKINGVIHLAGFKSVPESINEPIKYYDNNINSTLNLIKCMKKYDCKRLIFSSSATVYGSKNSPFYETMVINGKGNTSPYGRTKWFQEVILKDLCVSDAFFKVICLRYFNPIGNEPNGILGEDFLKNPRNLFPCILHSLYKKTPFYVYGNNYLENKIDGTPMRDFIHVCDLANAHIKTLDFLFDSRSKNNFDVFNIGLGYPVSVLQILNKFTSISNIPLNIIFKERRYGDVAVTYCNNQKALKKIHWKPKYTYEDACIHTWKYYSSFIDQ